MILLSDQEIYNAIKIKGFDQNKYTLIEDLKKTNENLLDFEKTLFVKNLSPNLINSNSNSAVLLKCLEENGVNVDEFISKYNFKSKKFFSNYLKWMSAEDTLNFYSAVQKELGKPNPRYFEQLGKKAAANQQNLHKVLFALIGGPSLKFMFEYLPTFNRGFNNIVSVQYVNVKKEKDLYKAIIIVKAFENFVDDWDIKNFFWFGGNILAIPYIKGFKNVRCSIPVYQYNLEVLLKKDYGYLNLDVCEENGKLFINREIYASKVFIEKERIRCCYSTSKNILNVFYKIIKSNKIAPEYKDILSHKFSNDKKTEWACYHVERDFIDPKTGEFVIKKGEIYNAPYFRYEIDIYKKDKASVKSVKNKEQLDEYFNKLQEQVIELDRMRLLAEEEAKRSRQAEAKLSELYKKLEEKVEERTIELAKAKEQIELQSMEKTTYFINIAHETRTPATLIQNYIEKCLIRYPEDRDLHIVKNNVDKLIRDMVNFLDVEKIEQNRLSYEERFHFNLTSYLCNKADLFKPTADMKGLELIRKFTPDVYITSNIQAMDRILNNLLDNAIRYTQSGGSVTIELIEDKKEFVFITVADTGIGIPEDKQAHIFDKYYQISHHKESSQGIGIGLYITKNIIDSLGGQITFVSDVTGTSFTVKLPCGAGGEYISNNEMKLNAPSSISAETPVENFPIEAGRETILLVEDNHDLILSMRDYLIDKYNVICARDGKEGLDFLNHYEIDLIVSDIMMDKMNGYEFLQSIRNSNFKEIPFLFLTAKSGSSEELKGLSCGAIDYIQKPFAMEVLKARIHSILDYTELKKKAFELEKYRSIGMLTAGICHEIMNPLSGIKGPLYIIERNIREIIKDGNETILQGISFIKKNTDRINDIVNTMRALFHGEAYIMEKIDLNSFLKPIVDMIYDKNRERISIEINIPENFTIRTNKGAFTQIIMNILTNSLESINSSGIIQIIGKLDIQKSLLIRDTGCGIPKELLSKVFDLAFTSKKDKGGTGLGLYIVKELSDRLGISIMLNSEPGKGTEITLQFDNSFSI